MSFLQDKQLQIWFKQYPEIDFYKMKVEQPRLFNIFKSIHRTYLELCNYEQVETCKILFQNFHKAYNKIEKTNVFCTDIQSKLLELVSNFETAGASSCLIPAERIEQAMTMTKKGNTIDYFVDYTEVIDLIKHYYKVNDRGFFSNQKDTRVLLIDNKLMSDEEYDAILHISPKDDYKAAILRIVSDHIEAQVPYVDFWRYLLNCEFDQVSNGSMSTMWFSNEDEKEYNPSDLSNRIFLTFKKIIKKELSQIKELKEKIDTDDAMQFWIEW